MYISFQFQTTLIFLHSRKNSWDYIQCFVLFFCTIIMESHYFKRLKELSKECFLNFVENKQIISFILFLEI